MKLTTEQAQAACERRLSYEANMAVEGLHVSAEGRALLDRMDEQGIGYEEGVEWMKAQLRERGLIPACAEEATFAAE